MKCGLCVSECGNCGHTVRDDTSAVSALLASGRTVIAVLATEYVAALHPRTADEVERLLESMGFYAVESTLLGEELVALEYERLYAQSVESVQLRSTCPVVVDWIRLFYPQLVSALTPVVPPYIAQARLVRAVYPGDVAIVYVSPCYARKDEIFDRQFAGVVDAAIDFSELERLAQDRMPRTPFIGIPAGQRRPAPVKELSLTDGFPRSTVSGMGATDPAIIKVRGLRPLDRLLAALVEGEAGPSVVDMLNCEGCIDGPAVRPGLSVFAKRNIVAAELEVSPSPNVRSRDILSYLPAVDLIRSFDAAPVFRRCPSAEEIDAELAVGGFASRADAFDCGACGYPTCVEHAEAVLAGNSSWELCFPQQKVEMARIAEELHRSASTDALTDLPNRRTFDERLTAEAARTARYGNPLSLMMLDVDGFKPVNDRHGHVVGDSVLREVASLIRGGLRETDIAARYGGDEFAIILPSTGKTAAFAVAEKLRETIAGAPVELPDGSSVRVTVSIGVATADRDSADWVHLLEAADRALYQAKRSGRDQVRLSAG